MLVRVRCPRMGAGGLHEHGSVWTASDEAEGASRVLSGHIPAVSGVGRAGRQRQVPVKTQRLLVVKLVGHTMPITTNHHHWKLASPDPPTPRRSGAR